MRILSHTATLLLCSTLTYWLSATDAMTGSMGITKTATPKNTAEMDLVDEFAVGSGMVVAGTLGLQSINFFTGSARDSVESTLEQLRNVSANLIADLSPESQDNFDMELSDAIKAIEGKDRQYVTFDGLRRIGAGSSTLANVSAELASNADLFDMLANTTALADINRVLDNSLMLLNLTQTQLSVPNSLSSQSAGRKLQTVSCNNINWATVTTAQLQACSSSQIATGLNTQQTSLQRQQQQLALKTYNRMCVPYIRSSFSNDLKKNFDNDKSMKTCNDWWGCRECIEGRRDGGLVTQEDCNWVMNRDKQQWRMKAVDGGFFQMQNDEYKNCVLAPSGSQRFFTSAQCNAKDKNQQFEILEMSYSYGDPRIVLRLANSGTPGLCMTTERADDDDGIRFIPTPCTCSYSQLIKRDD